MFKATKFVLTWQEYKPKCNCKHYLHWLETPVYASCPGSICIPIQVFNTLDSIPDSATEAATISHFHSVSLTASWNRDHTSRHPPFSLGTTVVIYPSSGQWEREVSCDLRGETWPFLLAVLDSMLEFHIPSVLLHKALLQG